MSDSSPLDVLSAASIHYVLLFPNLSSDEPPTTYRKQQPSYSTASPFLLTSTDSPGYSKNRIMYEQALSIIQECVSGDEKRERMAAKELRQAWIQRFRTTAPRHTDTLPLELFQELMRDVVLSRLEKIPGLHLLTKTTSDSRYIICVLQASEDLLLAEAERQHLKLDLWPEVDPGEEYWKDPSKREKERYIWPREEAEHELYRLFLAGQIRPDQAKIFADETPSAWSRRLHVFERLQDIDLDVSRAYPPAIRYQRKQSIQYLFARYEEDDGVPDDDEGQQQITRDHIRTSPFRMMQKIRLMKSLLDVEFNCDRMRQHGILARHLCIHYHQPIRQDCFAADEVLENPSLESLAPIWTYFSAPRYLYKNGYVESIFSAFTYQPITDLRNYFGEELALYFAFVSLYGNVVAGLTILGVISFIVEHHVTPSSHNIYIVVISLCLSVFSIWFVKLWDERDHRYAFQWSSEISEIAETTRPGYRGRTRINPINNRPELKASACYQFGMRVIVVAIANFVLVFHVSAIYALLFLQRILLQSDYAAAQLCGNIVLALTIPLMSFCYHWIAVCLTELENHQTQSNFDCSLTIKYLIFESVNYYAAIILSLFISPYFDIINAAMGFGPPLKPKTTTECFKMTQDLFNTIIITLIAVNVFQFCGALIHYARIRKVLSPQAALEGVSLVAFSSLADTIETEIHLKAYEGVIYHKTKYVLVYGYTILFYGVNPVLAAFFPFIFNILKLRKEAYYLSTSYQRPYPASRSAEVSSVWKSYLTLLSFFNILTTISMACVYQFVPMILPATKDSDQYLFDYLKCFVLLAMLWNILSQAIEMYLEKGMDWKLLAKRNEHLENMYIYEMHDEQEDEDEEKEMAAKSSLPDGQVYLNGIYRHLISGLNHDEDAVTELKDQIYQCQLHFDALQKNLAKLQSKYGTSYGHLHLTLKEINILPVPQPAAAKGLKKKFQMKKKTIDPVVKIELHFRQKRLKRYDKKSNVIKRSTSPKWNQSFRFVNIESLDLEIHMKIKDWERLGKDILIGTVCVPLDEIISQSSEVFSADEEEEKKDQENQDDDDDDDSEEKQNTETIRDHVDLDLPLEIDKQLLRTIKKEMKQYGRPKLSISMGIQYTPVGKAAREMKKTELKIKEIDAGLDSYCEWNYDDKAPTA